MYRLKSFTFIIRMIIATVTIMDIRQAVVLITVIRMIFVFIFVSMLLTTSSLLKVTDGSFVVPFFSPPVWWQSDKILISLLFCSKAKTFEQSKAGLSVKSKISIISRFLCLKDGSSISLRLLQLATWLAQIHFTGPEPHSIWLVIKCRLIQKMRVIRKYFMPHGPAIVNYRYVLRSLLTYYRCWLKEQCLFVEHTFIGSVYMALLELRM